jgi:hypothetical protein
MNTFDNEILTDKFNNKLSVGDWVVFPRTKLGNANCEIAIGKIKSIKNQKLSLDTYQKSDYGYANSRVDVLTQMELKPTTVSIDPLRSCKLSFIPN